VCCFLYNFIDNFAVVTFVLQFKSKEMKKKFLIILTVLSIVSVGNSQEFYSTAIGIRGGYPGYGSLNVKHFFSQSKAVEFMASRSATSIWFQGAYELNTVIGNNTNMYYGLVADVEVRSKKTNTKLNNVYPMILGVGGIVGIEYTFDEVPFNIAFDVIPRLPLYPFLGDNIYSFFFGSVALRYYIK
jgi:hypothetical protein